jgi:hypothetical protein
VFQVHYTPNGIEQSDQSSAALVFADPATVKKRLAVNMALNFQFRIPPGDPDFHVSAEYRFDEDMVMYTMLPHMHLRGKSFRFNARYPDGRLETLLDVPRYDFNWQNAYIFAEPKPMPEGTVLRCEAVFDNSEDNLVNPDPTTSVGWGDQTWEEMMIGSFDAARAEEDLTLGRPRVERVGPNEYRVKFRYGPATGDLPVYLAGTFNEWNPRGLAMTGPDDEGFFSADLTLAAGTYEYKFVIDGTTWRSDPGNPDRVGFYKNSVLSVE